MEVYVFSYCWLSYIAYSILAFQIIWELDPNRQYTTGSSGSESSTSTFNGAAGTSNGEEATSFVQGDFSVTATTYYGEVKYYSSDLLLHFSDWILLPSEHLPHW